jgi:hypothetical protein
MYWGDVSVVLAMTMVMAVAKTIVTRRATMWPTTREKMMLFCQHDDEQKPGGGWWFQVMTMTDEFHNEMLITNKDSRKRTQMVVCSGWSCEIGRQQHRERYTASNKNQGWRLLCRVILQTRRLSTSRLIQGIWRERKSKEKNDKTIRKSTINDDGVEGRDDGDDDDLDEDQGASRPSTSWLNPSAGTTEVNNNDDDDDGTCEVMEVVSKSCESEDEGEKKRRDTRLMNRLPSESADPKKRKEKEIKKDELWTNTRPQQHPPHTHTHTHTELSIEYIVGNTIVDGLHG